MLGLLATLVALAVIAWLLSGGPGRVLRGRAPSDDLNAILPALTRSIGRESLSPWPRAALASLARMPLPVTLAFGLAAAVPIMRWSSRRRRSYVRLQVEAYRADRASAETVVGMFEALHKGLLRRWWRRLLVGQPTVGLEVHYGQAPREDEAKQRDGRSACRLGRAERHELEAGRACGTARFAWLAITCPEGLERLVEAALQTAYPNCRLRQAGSIPAPRAVLRLKKQAEFIKRVKTIDRLERQREPAVNRLMTVMGACGAPVIVQMTLTPAPASYERIAKRLYKSHEARVSRERRARPFARDRSLVEEIELRGGLDVQHRPLFFVELRVLAPSRGVCERVASQLRAEGAENRLVERGTTIRHGVFGLYDRRVQRGEGNPLPSFRRGVFASTEVACIWQLPSVDYMTVPFARMAVPFVPAPPSILRPADGTGTLRDALGRVSIHPDLRKQNTAVPGAVEQGKSSYLVATVAEDLLRARCAVIVLDPKGDAAEAVVSLVPPSRTCMLLDFSHPTCGFNPLGVAAPADVIADYVVAALKNLFTDGDIRASSDRYLRNAIIAVLAYDRGSTLWDAARLLSVGQEGYSYRSRVGARVRTFPEFKEICEFFTGELGAQLADARSTTTAKLDAPVNKLARLLNSPSIKRVLLNDSLTVDFDRVIRGEEVLVVKGALGAMGAGNTSVLMQLLVGMLDASLARQQDLVPAEQRVAVALKVDEAPLVLNRGFAETIALKRSAGLETVACWQTEAQWIDREVRDQLDALFAHRVYFATASARDARAAVELMMAEFSDTVRPGLERLSTLGHPDVRLRLPKHHAIVSWVTPEGRQAPFIARTIPLRVDRERLAFHARRQLERGGRHRTDLRQPYWDRAQTGSSDPSGADPPTPAAEQPFVSAARSGVLQARANRRSEVSVRIPDPAAPGAPAAESQLPHKRLAGQVCPAGFHGRATTLPETVAESYRELVELDRAGSVRWATPVASPRPASPDRLDLEILALVAALRHVLTSQLHRHFNSTRAVTTTQRRLKRLSDSGLVERFQFHRRDGGGVPMCYVITATGQELLQANDRLRMPPDCGSRATRAALVASWRDGGRQLRQARHDVHVAGWALALANVRANARSRLRGAQESVLSPRHRSDGGGRASLALADLHLAGGRTPHDFLRTEPTGERIAVESFETLRPDAVVELLEQSRAHDVIVELDDGLASGRGRAKLERYDHFLSGWSAHTKRYGHRPDAVPVVVFVCRDRARARECARLADDILRASRAYAGEYPFEWEYPGRERVLFASERDIHEQIARAYGVARLPPDVRVLAARGDPRASEAVVESRELPAEPRRSSSSAGRRHERPAACRPEAQ
jgi:hypothetical protein